MKKAAPWIVLGAVLCATALQLRLQGRLWSCACGYILPWWGDINSSGNSQQLFDPYSFTHVIHGFLFIGIISWLWPRVPADWKLVGALSAEALWEIIENATFIIQRYRTETISIGYTGDTIINSFGDIVACALGVILARKIGPLKTLVLAGVIEVLLLVAIRDSLLLNIIMLLYPIDALRAWQAGH